MSIKQDIRAYKEDMIIGNISPAFYYIVVWAILDSGKIEGYAKISKRHKMILDMSLANETFYIKIASDMRDSLMEEIRQLKEKLK